MNKKERIVMIENKLSVLEDAIDSSVNGVIITNKNDEINYVNQTFLDMFEYDNENQVIGTKATDFFVSRKIRKLSYVEELISENEGETEEFLVQKKDNTEFYVEVSSSKVTNKKNEKVGQMASFVNIDKRKQMEEKLQHSQKLETIGQIMTGIAHQMNTPLAVIMTRLQILEDEFSKTKNEYLITQLDAVNSNVDRISEIIKKLLGFSRATDPDKKEISINVILNEVMFFISTHAKKNHVEVITNFTKNLPHVNALKNKMEQVFLNIIMNAFDAMPDGGKLSIESKLGKQKRTIEIIISDTGTGMSENAITNIFNPFFTTKPSGKGTGLGMYISNEVVKEHNGKILVESKLKKGAKFIISLPIKSKGNKNEHSL
ncbi:MAG: ATP-binding protein [Candidatus Cloacimonadota bacterium]|nr:ATP-binding protein [Candidatus Cloacimonadota bacterium]